MDDGCQIDLDQGQGQIIDGTIMDTIHSNSSYMTITFECLNPIVLNSDPNNYIRYLNINWVPLSCEVTSTEQTHAWQYKVCCIPQCLFKVISSPIRNTAQLASELGLEFYEKSKNLDLPSSHINVLSGNFILDNRYYSLEKSFQKNKNFTEGIYIYTNGRVLYSNTWKEIMSQTATELPENELSGNTRYTFQDDQMYDLYCSRCPPNVLSETDFYYNMIGQQFMLETNVEAQFFTTYTIKANNIEEFNVNESFLCISTTRDLMDPSGYTHYLAMMKIE